MNVRRAAWVAAVVIAVAAAGAWRLSEELRYLEPVEIERAPFPERGINVPSIAERNGATFYGKVKMRIYIQVSGDVDHIDITGSTVPTDIAQSTAKLFADVKWEPGTRNGRKRRSVNIVEVTFAPPVEGLPMLTPES